MRPDYCHDMKPTCPTCNHRMSPVARAMFICACCRKLVEFFDVRPIDHSLPWWEKYVELPTNYQTKAWVSMPEPQSKPPPVEPTGGSNKVVDERRALKPRGPSRDPCSIMKADHAWPFNHIVV